MATAFDRVCARCRLAGEKLFLKGEKCFTPKCPIVQRPYMPGIHGQRRRRPSGSEYGTQLREKQSLRAVYGLRERQLAKYFREARAKRAVTADALMKRLESRLDNVVFRAGFGSSRPHARQLVNHGLITVNGRRVDLPSYAVRVEDVVSITEPKRGKPVFADLAERTRSKPLPKWLTRQDPATVRVTAEPALEAHEIPVDVRAVVEFYSR